MTSCVPDASSAIVEIRKIRDYLLADTHPQNGGKAAFFSALGFQQQRPNTLQVPLHQHVMTNDIAATYRSAHGIKYVVRCLVETPDGRNPCIVTVWIVDANLPPRFVTAYPEQRYL